MQKKSLSRQVEDQLYNMIATRKRFHLGDKLPTDNELAQALGVSRATLREAVRSLTVQGILEARHGRGTYLVGTLYGDGSEGFVMVGVVSDAIPLPEEAGEDKHVTEYGDGTRILVDRKEHVVEIKDFFGSAIRMADGYIDLLPAKKVRVLQGGK